MSYRDLQYIDVNNQRPKRSTKRKRKKRHWFLVPAFTLIFLVGFSAFCAYVYHDYNTRVYKRCAMEAGNFTITAEDFLQNPTKPIKFADNFKISNINPCVPGHYEIRVESGIFSYRIMLTIEDTTPPSADAVDVTLEYGETCTPSDFIENLKDAQSVDVAFQALPDFSSIGKSPVPITLTDPSGNTSTITAVLKVVPVKKELTLEAGTPLPGVRDFLLDGFSLYDPAFDYMVGFDSSLEDIDTSIPGDYPVAFHQMSTTGSMDMYYESTLKVVDTIPPNVTLKPLEAYTTSRIKPEEFVEEIVDMTEVSFRYSSAPDYSRTGVQNVTITAQDAGGNATTMDTALFLTEDLEAPVIVGTKNITVFQGSTLSYKDGISVSDNCDRDISLNVNADAVNLKVLGDYPVVYSATDKAGNHSEITVIVSVIEAYYSEETVYALARQILDDILTPEMSDYDKLSAIYRWVRESITYSEADVKDNWLIAAYDGFTKHKGDCYIFCMTSKALLDEAGIKNMVIDTLPLKDVHYWNLVDIGEGWRHFDTTPRAGGGVFLYLDDAALKKYSDSHNDSHIYDRERFPDIN